ncbi:MAG: DUF4984 domain-containing protein [Fermentimonas sp.]
MNKLNIGSFLLLLFFVSAFYSCDSDVIQYEGPGHIMFSDSINVLPIQNNETYFDIPITATNTCVHDRIVAVEVDALHSNAIEDRHYTIESSSVVIKAGERVGNVRIRGMYDNIESGDSIGLVLRLIVDEKDEWDIYKENYQSKIILQKVCPFDINNFSGYAVLTSTYLAEFVPTSSQRLIYTKTDPDKENTVILQDYFYDGYDVKVTFTTKDVLNPLIEMEEQTFASTAEAFGTLYGDGFIKMIQNPMGPSYYSTCENFLFQYMTIYVPGMPVGTNVVGSFANVVEWISDDAAKKIKIEHTMNIAQSAMFAD